MAELDPDILAHLEWLGFVQPVGLVVSAPALVRAGAILDRRDVEGHSLVRDCVAERTIDPRASAVKVLPDFERFARSVLGWSFSPRHYAGTAEFPIPPELEVPLPDYGETLRPDFAVREPEPQPGRPDWQLLVSVLDKPGREFDRVETIDGSRLEASPHHRLERLLRETGVPAGLLVNDRALRLLSAPRGESSGYLDFRVEEMVETAGRPIAGALRLLLCEPRLLTLLRTQRLAALLEDSRKYQNEVSERLAEQVLHALYEFLRGFQSANDASKGELLREPLASDPDAVYRALLTVILRLVFVLYAEERGLLPADETFGNSYSLGGLFRRLREDAALYPDTLDQRYGAWAQLVALFRIIHDGADTGTMRLPPRHGVLFDPDRFPFLEGRSGIRQSGERLEPPLVPDGTIYRALTDLLLLDGERLSYRALDVEQIGSVYETMMGFRLETATGRTAAIRSQKKAGAPTAVDLDALLAEPPEKREKWLADRAERKLTPSVRKPLAAAATMEDLHAALVSIIDKNATPDLVPAGAMVLQPSEERRRSGSHYTPRSLTEPIVRKTLEPVLARLRGVEPLRPPRPEAILDLKVCDPAMGSGAFLIETCRQLGDALIEAWRAHGGKPAIPPDEDEVVFAQRLVAQRCLYGVDKNPVAVDLAKVSLWLATLAKDHPLTFVDHALRHGDSLVGLSRRQIEALDWDDSRPFVTGFGVRESIDRVRRLREEIRNAGDDVSDRDLRDLWDEAQQALATVQLHADLVVAAFFEGDSPKARAARRGEVEIAIVKGEAARLAGRIDEWRAAEKPLVPFHWEIEFPEVFERPERGFDAIVGNPPFAGKNTMADANVAGYPDWLKQLHEESHGNADLVAHFFRRAFHLLRPGGAFGLIATNTIGQGDTRSTGLRWICKHGGEIIAARRRVKWPGLAAVVVSVVNVVKGPYSGRRELDAKPVDTITAFLFHRGGHDDPARLEANAGKSFQGSIVLGMGFTFDDTDTKGIANPRAEMRRLIEKDPRNADRIFPYIGGEEVNTSPTHAHHRYVINFGEMIEAEARQWPDLMAIVETRVKPERAELTQNAIGRKRSTYWWQYGSPAKELYASIAGLGRVLVISQTSRTVAFAFLSTQMVYSHKLVVFPDNSHAFFAVMQSRAHDGWSRFFGSTMKDDAVYTPSDCFETFPFPKGWETRPALETAGRAYYEFRAALMVRNDEGLTKTYNRFHDPDERDPDILKLRELHAAMDRAVLGAYGWSDIDTTCEFLLDFEIENEEEWGDKKKPWRYRWPDAVRDEVLARLLELNAERAREETIAGAIGRKPTRHKNASGRDSSRPKSKGLFP